VGTLATILVCGPRGIAKFFDELAGEGVRVVGNYS